MKNSISEYDIKRKIKEATYVVLPDGRTTLCQLTLENGFTVNGSSACINPASFNIEAGRKIAYETAVAQIWQLEGYLTMENLYRERMARYEKKPTTFTLNQ